MAEAKLEVVVTDVKVHFWSMVLLLVEWAIAAIPALIIVYLAAMAAGMALDAVFGPAWHWWTAQST